MKKYIAAFLISMTAVASSAHAAIDLQITEIYFGQLNPDPTSDWFEITNYGDMAYSEAVDGTLYADDFMPDPTKADPIVGITGIAPGESVIVLVDFEDDFTDVAGALSAWTSTWGNIPGLTVGTQSNGSGLSSSNSDGPTIWLGDPNSGGILLDTETYPAPESIVGLQDGASYDVVLGDFSFLGNAAGAYDSAGLGGGDGIIPPFQPSIASPGSVAVPEPTTTLLAGIAAFAAAGFRRC